MSVPAHDLCLSREEYLELEETSKERHEYVAGRIFAMVGTTDAHNVIVSNLHRYLYDPVRASQRRIYIGDMKVMVEASDSFYYPDIMVSCEPYDARSVYKSAPCLIIEVLSPSTMNVDRREKLIGYRHLPSLVEYVLVYQDQMKIEVYRKDISSQWHCSVFNGADQVPLTALSPLAVELNMQDVYFGTDLVSSTD
jgi:Uma2 family endonuclease